MKKHFIIESIKKKRGSEPQIYLSIIDINKLHIYLLLNINVSNFITNYIVGPPSLYEGSLCNYKLSPTSSISLICVEEDAQMISSPKYAAQQDNKSEADNKTSCIKIFLSYTIWYIRRD